MRGILTRRKCKEGQKQPRGRVGLGGTESTRDTSRRMGDFLCGGSVVGLIDQLGHDV